MAKGYWMFHVTVNDPDTYQKYIEHDAPVFAKYGGRFLARGGAFQALEGAARQRHVIIDSTATRPHWPTTTRRTTRRRPSFAAARRSPTW